MSGPTGPDQDQPAAWADPDGYLVESRDQEGRWSFDEDADFLTSNEHAHEVAASLDGYLREQRRTSEPQARVVALVRAPGAVAAAPPGDEAAVLARVRALATTYANGRPRTADVEHLIPSKALLAVLDDPSSTRAFSVDGENSTPAPPAGHEDAVERAAAHRTAVAVADYFDEQRAAGADVTAQWVRDHSADIYAVAAAARGPRPVEDEDAVERAARAIQQANIPGASWEGRPGYYQESYRRVARAALAAARGPRTPDPAAGQDRP